MQLIPPFPPDNTGESDLDYFTARPNERHRIGLPLLNEFPRKLLRHRGGGTAMVVVVVQRDGSGRPTRRARGISFIDGGRA